MGIFLGNVKIPISLRAINVCAERGIEMKACNEFSGHETAPLSWDRPVFKSRDNMLFQDQCVGE